MRWNQLYYCVFLSCLSTITSRKCSSTSSTPIKFSIISRRNDTGHWIAKQYSSPPSLTAMTSVHSCLYAQIRGMTYVTTVVTPVEHFEKIAPTSMPPPPTIGYDLIDGFGYYKLHSDVKTWDEARSTCEQEGAHLLIINSEEEAKALGPLWDAKPNIVHGETNDWAHAGFHDLYNEGQYLTIFNQTLEAAGYAKWYPFDPNGVGQNCGMVVRRGNDLADVQCNREAPFFCEKEL